MSYIVVTCWYPSHITLKVVQKYLDVMQAVPEDENLASFVVPFAGSSTKHGTKALSILEVKPGKLEEALELVQKRMVMFHEIEGFEYSMEVQSTAAETLALIGMSAPE